MRLFVAVLPPSQAIEHLRAVVPGLAVAGARAGVIRSESWHLTVAFLGDVPDQRLDSISAAVAAGAAGGRSGSITLAGGGRFGDAVLWVGVTGDVDALARTARAVGREVRKARVKLERRPYRPHLTLARPRTRVTPAELRADVERLNGYSGPSWPADRIHLMRSEQVTTPDGQLFRYSSLASWPLPAAPAYQEHTSS